VILIETERLILRQIVPADAEEIFAFSRGPETGRDAGWKPHETLEETRLIMQEIFLEQESVFGMVLKETGVMIGSVGLIDDPLRENDSVRMLGYALGEAFWGQGFMTEAAGAVVTYGFEEMDLDLISATCYPFNLRSKRVLEKLGFRYEGTLAQAERRYDGKVLDKDCYSLSKEAYFENRF
jgi:putative acetyltransferase